LLSPLEESGDRVLEVKVKGFNTYKLGSIDVPVDVLRSASPNEWLFLETLGDISRKIESASRYDLVRLSALLRQLFLDQMPLAVSVNRAFRARLEFHVAIKVSEKIEAVEFLETHSRSLFPTASEEAMPVQLDRFLKLEVINHHGIACTVHDVIDAVAHVYGGVHLVEARSEKNEALVTLEQQVLLTNQSLVLESLRDIGLVALKALMPLAEATIARYHGERQGEQDLK